MDNRKVWQRSLDHPKISLILWFVAWKFLLLCIVIWSPGPGYDTSTMLLRSDQDIIIKAVPWPELASKPWLRKLVRWDAIYFIQIAQRGYVWEQDWAFGWGFTKLLAFVGRVFWSKKVPNLPDQEALAGVIVSYSLHLLSVLMLHELTLAVYSTLPVAKRFKLAFLAASLHVISPAGMFLAAPYAESSFSFLNFTGFYLYAKTLTEHPRMQETGKRILILLSGITFGVATTFRGNGLISGLILVYDAIICVIMILRSRDIHSRIRRLFTTCLSGILMASIAILPQYLAYREYCYGESRGRTVRPWCSDWVPSIYAWVQREYWGAGFLKYWTISNLPLFILAAPMLYILGRSGIWTWYEGAPEREFSVQIVKRDGGVLSAQDSPVDSASAFHQRIAFRFAVPQIVLAVLALTTYHVQIITRLSSGYPVWYWWLASLILENHKTLFFGIAFNPAVLITRWMIIYAIVQGGLFASFLPPA